LNLTYLVSKINSLSPELLAPFLDLPNVRITAINQINNEILIYVTSTEDKAHCHKCGKPMEHFYGYAPEIKLRHLPILGHKVFIIIKPKRYLCQDHPEKTTTTQKLSWYRGKAKATNAYEDHILLSMINSTIEDVRHKEDIGYAVIENIIDKNITTEINWDEVKELNCIGIDEISLKKGHKDFVAIISAFVNGKLKVIAILKDRTKQVIKNFFKHSQEVTQDSQYCLFGSI
jgi:transposase